MNNAKRRPIRKKIQKIVLLLCVISLLLTSTVGVYSMLKIKRESENSLIAQTEQNINILAQSRASLADSELGKFSEYVENFASYINWLYKNPTEFVDKEILPPDAANKDILSMQRYPATERVVLSDIMGEVRLLGNLEQVWNPVVKENEDMITTIYVGTKSGFLISYDKSAHLGVTEGSYESYYDYFESSWYVDGMNTDGVFFTDVYPDSYGRGLTITCAAPFFDASDAFAGVVCMDILVTDLQSAIIDIDLGEGAYAFLVDRNGDIIASPYVKKDQEEFENIIEKDHPMYELSKAIMNDETGVSLAKNGTYYAYAPVAGTGWKLCISTPESLVLTPVYIMNDDIVKAIIIFIIAFVLTVVVVFVFVKRFTATLTKPLVELANDAKVISQGNLDHLAKIHNNDEIGDLAAGFNDMASSLKTYISDLTSVTAEKERIGAELDVATHIQSSMLPCMFPAFPEREEFDIFATMTPAKEVGGDFYDFFMVDDRHLAIVMADVSGKGVPAALFMVIGKTLIKDHTQPGRDLGEVFAVVNDMLCEANSEGLFITAFEGVLDLVTGEFRYVNAGHEAPYISRAGGIFEPHPVNPGFVLAGMEGMVYQAGVMTLSPGDRIFEYTDGVTEATNEKEELYGSDRLRKILATVARKSPHDILPAVEEDIKKFVGDTPQFDDITMLCVEYRAKMKAEDEEVSAQ